MTSEAFRDFLMRELWKAYREARKGKRCTMDEHKFELNEALNLMQLCDDIMNRDYLPSRSVAFIIRDPVVREIFAAPFRDRVVHHFLYNMTAGWWDRRLIDHSFSCRVGKGTLYGHQSLAKDIQAASNNFQRPVHVIKLDIRGYFMSLDRVRLVERINWGLERQFAGDKGKLYWTLRFLWKRVIMDDPIAGVRLRGSWKDWNDLPRSKSLFCQPYGKGIVIGNLSSQLLSNIYLDQLDRYVKFELGYKYYGRYVDDFYLVMDEERYPQALRDVHAIELYLERLGLVLHPKKRMFQLASKGVPFLGVKVYPDHTTPGKRLKKRFREAAVNMAEGHGDIEQIVSYLGHMKYICSDKFVQEVFDSLGWDYTKQSRRA